MNKDLLKQIVLEIAINLVLELLKNLVNMQSSKKKLVGIPTNFFLNS